MEIKNNNNNSVFFVWLVISSNSILNGKIRVSYNIYVIWSTIILYKLNEAIWAWGKIMRSYVIYIVWSLIDKAYDTM